MKRCVALGVILILVCASCASMDVGFRKAAAVSKLTVEGSYDVVYTAFLRGLITEETKDEAAKIRDSYMVVQSATVRAIQDSRLDEAAKLIGVAGTLAKEITDLIIQHKIEERMAANESG